jgi:cytosine/adenosine deaminase-related metal-dependent hydrolase
MIARVCDTMQVGLGTDIAGGYSPSMLVAQRMAVVNSHALKAAALMYGTWRAQEQQQQQEGGQQLQQQQQQEDGQQQQQGDDLWQGQQQEREQQPSKVQRPGEQQQQQQQLKGSTAGSKRAASVIANPAVAAAAAAHMLTWEDALWLATKGGAAALGLQETVGYFAVGTEFDALVIDVGVPNGPFDVLIGEGQPLVMLEQFLNNGDDRNILEVYVQGRRCV